jgi:hypothetical protein
MPELSIHFKQVSGRGKNYNPFAGVPVRALYLYDIQYTARAKRQIFSASFQPLPQLNDSPYCCMKWAYLFFSCPSTGGSQDSQDRNSLSLNEMCG